MCSWYEDFQTAIIKGKCALLMSWVNWEHWWGVRGSTKGSVLCLTVTRIQERTHDWKHCQLPDGWKWRSGNTTGSSKRKRSGGSLRLLTPNNAVLKIFLLQSAPAAQTLNWNRSVMSDNPLQYDYTQSWGLQHVFECIIITVLTKK